MKIVKIILAFTCLYLLWMGEKNALVFHTDKLNSDSVNKVVEHIQTLEQFGPRNNGSQGHLHARQWLSDRLKNYGLKVNIQKDYQCHEYTCAPVANVIARRSNGIDQSTLVVMAHYDTHAATPGAADNGLGVAIALALAERSLNLSTTHNLEFVFTDGEEWGLLGARAYFDNIPSNKKIVGVINLDARGNQGKSFLFESFNLSTQALQGYISNAEAPSGFSLLTDLYLLTGNNTDLSVFRGSEGFGVNFAIAGNLPAYHTALDSLAFLSKESIWHQWDNARAIFDYASTSQETLIGQGSNLLITDVYTLFMVILSPLSVLISMVISLVIALAAIMLLRPKLKVLGKSIMSWLIAVLGVTAANFLILQIYYLMGGSSYDIIVDYNYLWLTVLGTSIALMLLTRRLFILTVSIQQLSLALSIIFAALGFVSYALLPSLCLLFVPGALLWAITAVISNKYAMTTRMVFYSGWLLTAIVSVKALYYMDLAIGLRIMPTAGFLLGLILYPLFAMSWSHRTKSSLSLKHSSKLTAISLFVAALCLLAHFTVRHHDEDKAKKLAFSEFHNLETNKHYLVADTANFDQGSPLKSIFNAQPSYPWATVNLAIEKGRESLTSNGNSKVQVNYSASVNGSNTIHLRSDTQIEHSWVFIPANAKPELLKVNDYSLELNRQNPKYTNGYYILQLLDSSQEVTLTIKANNDFTMLVMAEDVNIPTDQFDEVAEFSSHFLPSRKGNTIKTLSQLDIQNADTSTSALTK